MPPLSNEQRAELLKKAAAAGIPKEKAFADLAELEGAAPPAPAAAPEPGTPAFGERAAQRAAALQPPVAGPGLDEPRALGPRQPPAVGSQLPPVVNVPDQPTVTPMMARQALAGGAAMAAAPFTAGMSLLPAAGAEGLIVGGADLGLQGLRKLMDPEYKVDPMESVDIGLTAGGTTAASRTAFDVLSRLGGVAPQFTRYFRNPKNIGRYNRVLSEPGKQAEFELGERIKKAVEDWTSTKVGARVEKEAMISQATQSGKKIAAHPIIGALEDVKLQSPKTPVGEKLNAEISSIQDKFKRSRVIQPAANVGNTYQAPAPRTIKSARADLTPKEVDEFLTREIDNRIYKLSGSPKNQALAEALANARPKIRETLLRALPPEAAALTTATEKELAKRAEVTKAIQPQLVSLETKIRNLFKPGHAGELKALEHVSKVTGIPFDEEAFKLAQQRSFSPDQRLATKGLDAVMELIRGALARPALKATAPLQSLVSPAASAAMAGRKESMRIPSAAERKP